MEDAFHRCLYWFCCKKKDCFEKSVRCFRNQLPEENRFYPEDNGSVKLPNLCELCGCRAASCCSKCKSVYYCSKSHQKAHWRHHKSCCTEASSKDGNRNFPSSPVDPIQLEHSFPEYEVVIEEEDAEDVQTKELVKNAKVMESTTIWDDAGRLVGSTASLHLLIVMYFVVQRPLEELTRPLTLPSLRATTIRLWVVRPTTLFTSTSSAASSRAVVTRCYDTSDGAKLLRVPLLVLIAHMKDLCWFRLTLRHRGRSSPYRPVRGVEQ